MPAYDYTCPNPTCVYYNYTIEMTHTIKQCDDEHLCPICESKQIRSAMQRVVTNIPTYLSGNTKADTIKIKV